MWRTLGHCPGMQRLHHGAIGSMQRHNIFHAQARVPAPALWGRPALARAPSGHPSWGRLRSAPGSPPWWHGGRPAIWAATVPGFAGPSLHMCDLRSEGQPCMPVARCSRDRSASRSMSCGCGTAASDCPSLRLAAWRSALARDGSDAKLHCLQDSLFCPLQPIAGAALRCTGAKPQCTADRSRGCVSLALSAEGSAPHWATL